MTIAEHLEAVSEVLAPWAQDIGGRVAIAGDANHLWNLLAEKPGAFRGVLLFDVETPRGELDELGRVDRKYILVISRGRGFTADRGDNFTKGSAGGKALYEIAEEARELIRFAEVESPEDIDETRVVYLGTRRFDTGDLVTDAIQIEFQIAAGLPENREDEEA